MIIEEFVQHLTDSGLMTAVEVFAHQDSLPPKKRPASAEELANSLVASEKLTAYQSEQLLKGRYGGLVLGDYEILEKIGGGGMGDVFKARHRRMKRHVALKTLPPRSIEAWEGTDRFQREIEAAGKLDHPNIVTAYDAGEARNIHFLVMQYIEGGDLHAIVNARGALAVEDAVGLVLQVARGLEYAHSQHVIHRDIKPSNILVDKSGTAKIVDMGLALLREPSPSAAPARQLTLDGETMGTADFMSPEQAQDAHRADERSDIYSLGCTLYFLLTGKSPYRAGSVGETIKSHIKKPIPSIRKLRAEAPRELDRIYKKMVAKNPDARYQTMSDVLQVLAVFAPAEQAALSGSGRSGIAIDPQATNVYTEGDSVRTRMTFATARDETSRGVRSVMHDTKPMVPPNRKWWPMLVGLGLMVIFVVGSIIFWSPSDRANKPVEIAGPQSPLELIEAPSQDQKVLDDKDARPQSPAPHDVQPVGKVRRLAGHTQRVNGIAFSTRGKIAASACADGTASLWNWETGEPIVNLEGHESAVTAVAFSPDGNRLVTGCGDGILRVWDGQSGELIWASPKNLAGGLLCAVFLPDNNQVLTGGWNNPIRLWDVEAKREVRQFEGVIEAVYSIAVDAEGNRAISGSKDNRVTVWNIETGTEIRRIEGHQREVKSVAYSPDGSQALSGSGDDTVRLWEVSSGDPIPISAPSFKPTCVAFLANGNRIVFGDRTQSLYVWDVATDELVVKFDDEDNVDCLAVSPDGQFLLSGTRAGTICLWRLPRISRPQPP